MRLVDLSVTIHNDAKGEIALQKAEITYSDHVAGKETMLAFFPDATEDDLPEGLGWAFENVSLGTHAGTHIDAPWHYHPTMSGGLPAFTVDEMPLEWCYGNGVKLDFSKKGDGYLIMPEDIEEELKRIGHTLTEGDIVLVQSGAGPYYESEEYLVRGCGMGRAATNYLTGKGVHVVGTDAWSWDRPLSLIAKEFAVTHDSSIIWEGHFAGIDCGYGQIEKLCHLDLLPPDGFKVACFPIKLKGASAAWIRPVAIFED